MRIVRDGFVWLGVTDKAKELYASRLFEIYTLHEDGSESLIQSDEVDKLRLMYGFVTKFGKQLRDDYKNISKKDRLITYEQFIVAQFSNLLEDGHH